MSLGLSLPTSKGGGDLWAEDLTKHLRKTETEVASRHLEKQQCHRHQEVDSEARAFQSAGGKGRQQALGLRPLGGGAGGGRRAAFCFSFRSLCLPIS